LENAAYGGSRPSHSGGAFLVGGGRRVHLVLAGRFSGRLARLAAFASFAAGVFFAVKIFFNAGAAAKKFFHLMKILTIDIGNTRTHCALVDAGGGSYCVLSARGYPSADFSEIFLKDRLFAESGAEAVSWCSVVPRYSERLKNALAGIENMQLTHENSPIPLDVKFPEQVGQDRIADAAGAGLFFEPPYIVVDMGTAVTIDLVDARGCYCGGAIAPGMHAFTDYLGERAAQLPKINPVSADYDMSIGKDTVSAMLVGCVKGFCKLADGIIGDIERDFFGGAPAREKCVFTGGSVGLLPKKWLADRKIESNLANLGLAYSFLKNKGRA